MVRLKDFKAEVKDVQRVWITAKEACKFLGCSPSFLKTLRNNDQVLYASSGNGASGKSITWYNVQSLNKYIERNIVNKKMCINR